MQYCTRCLYPKNHPLGIVFDDEGVCSGCRVHEEKDEINWIDKEEEFLRILKARFFLQRNFENIKSSV